MLPYFRNGDRTHRLVSSGVGNGVPLHTIGTSYQNVHIRKLYETFFTFSLGQVNKDYSKGGKTSFSTKVETPSLDDTGESRAPSNIALLSSS